MFKFIIQIVIIFFILGSVMGQNLYTLAESYGANGDDTNEKQFKYINRL